MNRNFLDKFQHIIINNNILSNIFFQKNNFYFFIYIYEEKYFNKKNINKLPFSMMFARLLAEDIEDNFYRFKEEIQHLV